MRKVHCHECGKTYDYDEDDFCPRCGSYTQPARTSRIGADGQVVWVDGLNERNHQGSFVHEEFHEENKERRRSGLSKGIKRGIKYLGSKGPQETIRTRKQCATWKKKPSTQAVAAAKAS